MLNNIKNAWIEGKGANASIVINSRIQLSRNIARQPFPHYCKKEVKEQILEHVKEAFFRSFLLDSFFFIKLNDLTLKEKQSLVEKQLISPLLSDGSAVFLDKKGWLSLMVNEKDHLKSQCLCAGLELRECWEKVNNLDTILEQSIPFAFSERFGYLASSPDNLGTGLRASVTIHLPALVLSNLMPKITCSTEKKGLTTREFFKHSDTAYFQISTKKMLDITEEETINLLEEAVKEVINQEIKARNFLKKEMSIYLTDKIWRAYGLLSHARLITIEELLEMISYVRLGVDMEILPKISIKNLNEILVKCMPASMQTNLSKELTAEDCNVKRAGFIRKILKA